MVYDVERTPPEPLGSYLTEHEAETCAANLRRAAGGDIVVRELEVVAAPRVAPLLAGLVNGAASHVGACPCERLDDDPEYVRGYGLGRGDVEARLAMARPVAADLDELPPGGHVLRRESSRGIVPDPWPSPQVEALYTPAQWAGLQSRSERNADGDGDA